MIQKTSLLLPLVLLAGCVSAQPQLVDFANMATMKKVPSEKTMLRASCPDRDYLSWNVAGYWQCSGWGLTYPASLQSVGGEK